MFIKKRQMDIHITFISSLHYLSDMSKINEPHEATIRTAGIHSHNCIIVFEEIIDPEFPD